MSSRTRLGFLLLVGAVVSACAARPTAVLYVANQGSDDVSAYAIDRETGALTPIAGSPFRAGSAPGSIAAAPSGQVVYVVNRFSHDISAYTVGTDGALRPVRGSPFSTEQFPMAGIVAASGRFLHVVSSGAPRTSPDGPGRISTYAIDAKTGALSPVAGSPLAAGSAPGSVAASPSGRFVYVTNLFSRDISAYAADATTGALAALAGSPFPPERTKFEGPKAVHPVTGAELSFPVWSFEVHFTPTAVIVAPSGRFGYVTGSTVVPPVPGALSLQVRPGAPVTGPSAPPGAGGPAPAPAALTPLSSITAYVIDESTGALVRVSGSPWTAGRRPAGMTVDPSSRFAYVVNVESADISAYAIDPVTGALAPVAGSPFPAGTRPTSVAVDPTGRFLYVANSGSNNISAYAIDTTTGGLRPVARSPFRAGSEPISIAATGTTVR